MWSDIQQVLQTLLHIYPSSTNLIDYITSSLASYVIILGERNRFWLENTKLYYNFHLKYLHCLHNTQSLANPSGDKSAPLSLRRICHKSTALHDYALLEKIPNTQCHCSHRAEILRKKEHNLCLHKELVHSSKKEKLSKWAKIYYAFSLCSIERVLYMWLSHGSWHIMILFWHKGIWVIFLLL